MTTAVRSDARRLAESVLDPEMPMLTLADLGVLRDVEENADGSVIVTITPTYSGCPAMATMRDDIEHTLQDAGFGSVEVRTVLTPPWSTDWISDDGRRKLRENGYSTPGPAPLRTSGPVPLTLTVKPRAVTCPVCHSANTRLDSEFGATLCKALYRCLDCLEPFDHVKEI
ncbi:Phenylacetate-CoA oxygenase, PaaJ subunit [Rhodococcus wratislaviensis]|uniref:Phenylacetate-CoA oxygenase, PaaJ subunit n=1 Tax=Rhodococcus wratislaviensis TaxID=44752 RepID=A0A402CGW4_RHOWR|nr:1,2-phenylacetyl-CoA epoxidase subunit PaaD [Rhodococcus wratislaviensis]GCE42851.1 Phenylacetate-CoA oxygenase, PaaJ subunit [Rhodococcus wratislaviensis]